MAHSASMGPGDLDAARLRVRLLGVPATASTVRRRIRAWLDGLDWPEHETDDVVLAVHEAVANSVEHGYRDETAGDVEITGERIVDGDVRRVRVVVRDDGRWRPPRAPGHRGRGIVVMRGCTAGVDVRPGGTGTEVVLISRPVPVTTAEARPRLASEGRG